MRISPLKGSVLLEKISTTLVSEPPRLRKLGSQPFPHPQNCGDFICYRSLGVGHLAYVEKRKNTPPGRCPGPPDSLYSM
jgi:hypothetical protein